jgi:hypothetical protein
MTTATGIGFVAISAGAAIGGLVHAIVPLAIAFAAINAVAAVTAARMRAAGNGPDRQASLP